MGWARLTNTDKTITTDHDNDYTNVLRISVVQGCRDSFKILTIASKEGVQRRVEIGTTPTFSRSGRVETGQVTENLRSVTDKQCDNIRNSFSYHIILYVSLYKPTLMPITESRSNSSKLHPPYSPTVATLPVQGLPPLNCRFIGAY